MVVVSSTIAVGQIGNTLDEQAQPQGDGGAALETPVPALWPMISLGGPRRRRGSGRRGAVPY